MGRTEIRLQLWWSKLLSSILACARWRRRVLRVGLTAFACACLGFVGCQHEPDREPALVDWAEFYAGDADRYVSYRALFDKRRQIVAVVVCYWPYGLAQEHEFVRVTVRTPPDAAASGLWVKGERIPLAGLQRPAVILLALEESTGQVTGRRLEGELTDDQIRRLLRFAKPFPNEDVEQTAARFRAMVQGELLGPGV